MRMLTFKDVSHLLLINPEPVLVQELLTMTSEAWKTLTTN